MLALSTILAATAGGQGTTPGTTPVPSRRVTEVRGVNQLTPAERAAGWRLLFDGRTLNGWRGLGYSGVPREHWVVADGAIRKVASGRVPTQADGQPLEGGDLMTEATLPFVTSS